MPLDYRRFNGPEDSIPYAKTEKPYDEARKQLTNEQDVRSDGRTLEESRNMFARLNMISQAKGSAFFELKKTKVICSVFDPREIPHQNEFSELGQIYCEVKFAPFSCPRRRRAHAPDSDDKAMSVALRQALEPAVCRHLFPNYQIDVFVYVLEHDGACLAAAVNAAGLALVDAGVPMFDIIASCSAVVIGDDIFIDPTEAEEHLALTCNDTELNHGVITLSKLSSLKQISDFTQIGSIDVESITKILDILDNECEKLVLNIQQVHVKNELKKIKEQKRIEEETKEREIYLDNKMKEWKSLLNIE